MAYSRNLSQSFLAWLGGREGAAECCCFPSWLFLKHLEVFLASRSVGRQGQHQFLSNSKSAGWADTLWEASLLLLFNHVNISSMPSICIDWIFFSSKRSCFMPSPSKLLGNSHHPGSYGRLSFIGRFLLKPESLISLPQTSSCPNLALKQNVPRLAWSFLGLLVIADLLLRGSTPLLTHTLNQLCVVTATVTLRMRWRGDLQRVFCPAGPGSRQLQCGTGSTMLFRVAFC